MQHCRTIFGVFGFASVAQHAIDTTIVILLTLILQ